MSTDSSTEFTPSPAVATPTAPASSLPKRAAPRARGARGERDYVLFHIILIDIFTKIFIEIFIRILIDWCTIQRRF